MRHIYTTVIIFSSFILMAQPKLERQVFGIAGTSAHSSSVHLEWTLGEVAVSTFITGSGMLSEGFQQTFDQAEPNISLQNNKYEIRIIPNPASSFFTISFLSDINDKLHWELIDITGKTLQRNIFDTSLYQEIDINLYADGLYVLKISGENISQIHKIVKTSYK